MMWLRTSQVFLLAVVVNSKLDVDSAVRMARCRVSCIYKVTTSRETEARCQKSANCSECWSTCLRLQSSGHNETICGGQNCGFGCSVACRWWAEQQHHVPGLPHSHEATPWPRPQAKGAGSSFGSSMAPHQVHKQRLAQAKAVIHSLGLDDAIRLADSLNTSVDNSWRVALMSLYHQPELVSAEISWKADRRKQQSADCQTVFLVTWSVEGGVVRGNLVTNSSTAVLSLWPDTVYRIQVTALSCSSAGLQSASTLVDTRRAPESRSGVPQDSVSQPSGAPQGSVLAGVAAAASLFLAILLAFTWRARHILGLPHSKLIDEDYSTPNLYRVFPPAVRLVRESNIKQGVFTSTDNLLQAVNFDN